MHAIKSAQFVKELLAVKGCQMTIGRNRICRPFECGQIQRLVSQVRL